MVWHGIPSSHNLLGTYSLNEKPLVSIQFCQSEYLLRTVVQWNLNYVFPTEGSIKPSLKSLSLSEYEIQFP